jgi:hypothetical protein
VLNAAGKKAAGLLVVEDLLLHGLEYTSRAYEDTKPKVVEVKRKILPVIILEFLGFI